MIYFWFFRDVFANIFVHIGLGYIFHHLRKWENTKQHLNMILLLDRLIN